MAVPSTEQRRQYAKKRGLVGKTGDEAEGAGRGKLSRGFNRMLGKGSYLQNKGYMKKYVPAATSGAPSAAAIMGRPWGKTVDQDNAIDSLQNTLSKAYGRLAKAVFGSEGFGTAIDKVVGIVNKFAPAIGKIVENIKKSGLGTHEVNQLMLAFRNSMVDAVLEEYQKEQAKLPEDDREPISRDDVAALFATRKEFVEWMKDDLEDVQQGGQQLKNTERVTKAIGELEEKSGKRPDSLKALQNDTLETIRELHKMGLIDEKALFSWLK